ncbi:stalk domain-containing protein [Paenibacillus sinopodophylli]|uniref:stalk domain-containing protein n=1 Tax=Paenibacillus sinopodophylli TaxID=1837342 RepID=UPI00110CF459|nr:stalk domain-containing protein [Paenibacillus sinopodophylli]
MQIKKSVFVGSLLASSLVFGVVGVGAATGIQKIQAALNHNIGFKVDGSAWTPKDQSGNKMSAIVYNGSTYLPLRATAEDLGASVNYDNAKQLITLNSGNNSGIPFNDVTTPSTNTNNNSNSGNTSTPATAVGIIKLTGTEAQMTEKMKKEAVAVIKALSADLKSGKPTVMNAYFDNYVSGAIAGSPMGLAKEYYKEQYGSYLASNIEANSKETMDSFSSAIAKVTVSDIKVFNVTTKDEYDQTFSYSYQPQGWDAFSAIYLYFKFSANAYGSSNYILSQVSF